MSTAYCNLWFENFPNEIWVLVQVKIFKLFSLFIRPITVLNFGLMKIFCERNIEANAGDENSGKIHDYVGLSEFIQRDDPFRSRFIINVHASATFVTDVFSDTFLSPFHCKLKRFYWVRFVDNSCWWQLMFVYHFCFRKHLSLSQLWEFSKFEFKRVITGI